MKKIHILGICGTFMGGVALLARQKGYEVSGTDDNVYPPMSTLLQEQGIAISKPEAFGPLSHDTTYIVGNSIARGKPLIEGILNQNLSYTSGPEWLKNNVLKDKWVIAVAGTHGKTTTSSLVTWILEYAGLNPGFLIGGVPENFGVSARLTDSPFFVIEADEYDTAFFDKRAKVVHSNARTLVINNVEFDHADIYDNVNEIIRQFHHAVRIVPGDGLVIAPKHDVFAQKVLEKGCWSQHECTDDVAGWSAVLKQDTGSEFDVYFKDQFQGTVNWQLIGTHNVHNALSAIAAARHAGVQPSIAIQALAEFKNVKRRLELKGVVKGITVLDDFAHHPTAIKLTLDALRAREKQKRILVAMDFRSNSMKRGVFKDQITDALQAADRVYLYQSPDLTWSCEDLKNEMNDRAEVADSVENLVKVLVGQAKPDDIILVMSNGGFGVIHEKLLKALA